MSVNILSVVGYTCGDSLKVVDAHIIVIVLEAYDELSCARFLKLSNVSYLN